ncbi:MAG: esterase/lipase family protein [Candidatus Woesearchaeota archaeon]
MRKKIIRAIIILLIVIFVVLLIYAYRTINLIIKEEILINTGKNYETVTLQYGERYEFSITADIQNYWLCKAECVHSIKDLATNNYLFNETFYVTNNRKVSESVLISPRRGYGQNIFQYTIECANIETSRCPSDADLYKRTNTLVLNYLPNANQEILINELLNESIYFAAKLSNTQENMDVSAAIIQSAGMNFSKDEILKDADLRKDLEFIKRDYNAALIKWNNDEYEDAKTLIKRDDLEILNIASLDMLNKLKQEISLYNEMIILHRASILDAKTILEMMQFYPLQDEDFYSDAKTSIWLVNTNTQKFFYEKKYEALAREARLEEINVKNTLNSFNNASDETKGDYVDLYLANLLSCKVLDCNITELNYSLYGLEDIKYRCNAYSLISQQFTKAKNITKNNREAFNESLQAINLEEKQYIVQALNNFNYSQNPSITSRIEKYILEINLTPDNQSINLSNNSKYYSLAFAPLTTTMYNIGEYCSRSPVTNKIDEFNMTTKEIPALQSEIKYLPLQIPKTKCCIYSKCEECGIEKKYPLILLHGHSFNQKNSAYQSTEIYNILENNLTKNDYVSLGVWLNGEYNPYISLQNVKILTKPTYYITTTILGSNTIESKDESIDAYADRLKEYIENILYTTGRSKTDIVAHSMGGLVVRRYVQKYGPERINKLILIGTPNNGIDDRIYTYCKLFGNEKECDDMHHNSSFILEVSKTYPMPETYLIIGKGCDMNGYDGDGIVLTSSSEMKGYKTYYIEGNCTTTGYMHSAMLEKYPQVTKIIIELLE